MENEGGDGGGCVMEIGNIDGIVKCRVKRAVLEYRTRPETYGRSS